MCFIITFGCIRKRFNPKKGLVEKLTALKILVDYKKNALDNNHEITDDKKE
jgi:hypothetical protein